MPRVTGSLENSAQLKRSSTVQERRQLQGPREHPTLGACIAMCSLLLSAPSIDNTDNLVYSGLLSPFRVGHGPISSEEFLVLLLISVVWKKVSPIACWAGSPLLSEQHFQSNGYGQLRLGVGSVKRHTAECFEMDIWHAVNAFRKQ